jgi:general stress protein 26
MPIAELNTDFSSPAATAPPWSRVQEVLERSEIFWLSTVRRDGRPHVTPLPAVWLDGTLHFCTGDQEQKARNLEHDPRVVLTTGSNALRSGLDVVVEGTAVRVSEHATLHRLAELWNRKLDWDFEVGADSFRDPAGRIGLVFGVTPAKVLAFGKGEPFSQTRYRF